MSSTVDSSQPLSGRRAEAARNDGRILDAAREVFIADPGAPISAVAERAGVGIGALYRRYPSKDVLLQTLCADGLGLFVAEAEAALADEREPWESFVGFLERVVDGGAGSLTRRLAGTFTPTPELYALAARAQELHERVVERARNAGVLRRDVEAGDLGMIYEQLAAIRLGDEARTAQLRRRYLTLLLQAMRAVDDPGSASDLPGPAPRPEELAGRWR